MCVVVTVNCDRCGDVISAGARDPTAAKAVDLEVSIPWGHDLQYPDLCDGCRHAVVGYLASAFKLDRTVFSSQCRGNGGGELKAPEKGEKASPTLPLTPKQADERAAEDAVEQKLHSKPLDEGVQL